MELRKRGFSFCVLKWNENPAAATELTILFETSLQLLLLKGTNREARKRMVLINSTSRTAEKKGFMLFCGLQF